MAKPRVAIGRVANLDSRDWQGDWRVWSAKRGYWCGGNCWTSRMGSEARFQSEQEAQEAWNRLPWPCDPLTLEAQQHERLACLYSRAHKLLVRWGIKTYGQAGPAISAVYQTDWPEPVKRTLAGLCDKISASTNASWTAWKRAGRRAHTWRRMREDYRVRYGAGFYG